MKFVIALVSYLESLGYDTSSLRKSADGSKAIVHMQYAEILSKNLDTNANVTIYDRVNPDFQALLASDEWNGNVTGTPNSFGDLAELAKYEARLTTQVTEAKTDMDNFQTEIAGEVTTAKEDLNAIVDNYQVTVNQQLADTLNKSAITLTHMFADNTARDAYFVAHPTELIELQFIKVGTGYQQYIAGVWTDSVPIVAEQVSASNQPIVDTGGYFATDNTNAALQEIGAKLFIKCQNKLTNGNLSDGLNNWLITGTVVLDSGAAKINYAVSGRLRQNIVGSTNDKIYTRMVQTVVGATDGVNIIEFRKNSVRVIFQSIPTQSGAFSNVSTLSGDVDDFSIVRVAGTSGYVLVDNLMVLNLTDTFGVGNEPTAPQMDRLLTQFPDSWFDGTENIFLAKWALNEFRRLDSEKATKTQEAWITPTLVNSWVAFDTRTAKYKKADYGRVYLKGLVKNGTVGATIFTLPTGYRPEEALIFGVITVNTDGTVVCTSGVNTSVSLSGVNFFV